MKQEWRNTYLIPSAKAINDGGLPHVGNPPQRLSLKSPPPSRPPNPFAHHSPHAYSSGIFQPHLMTPEGEATWNPLIIHSLSTHYPLIIHFPNKICFFTWILFPQHGTPTVLHGGTGTESHFEDATSSSTKVKPAEKRKVQGSILIHDPHRVRLVTSIINTY